MANGVEFLFMYLLSLYKTLQETVSSNIFPVLLYSVFRVIIYLTDEFWEFFIYCWY